MTICQCKMIDLIHSFPRCVMRSCKCNKSKRERKEEMRHKCAKLLTLMPWPPPLFLSCSPTLPTGSVCFNQTLPVCTSSLPPIAFVNLFVCCCFSAAVLYTGKSIGGLAEGKRQELHEKSTHTHIPSLYCI